jgi:ATP-dependent DNA helicase RecG
MLDAINLLSIVNSGEGYNAEFKVNIPTNMKSITEEVCAFANASGGVVLIGVDDKNSIKGITLDNAKRSALQNSLKEISPALQCDFYIVEVEGKSVAVIEVPSGLNKPYVLSGAIFIRQGPNSQKLTTVEEMRSFFQQTNRIYFDESPCIDIDVNTDLDLENIEVFRTYAGLHNSISNKQVFENLKLFTKEGYLKNGAVLFFANEPEQYFEKAVIRCVAFSGTDKRYIADDKVMKGPLYKQFEESMLWLRSKLAIRYDIEGEGAKPRKEIWEIPETVFKEAIINSLAHRDYYDKGGRITIELFADRVEISNPGGLVSAITPSEFGKRSLSRNPLIFGLFERMRMVEQIGSGINRMIDLMRTEKLTPPEFSTDGIFTVTLRRPFDFDKWVNKWVNKLTAKQILVLDAIHKNPKIKKVKLQELTAFSSTALDNNLVILKTEKLLKREGTKGGVWVLHYIVPEVGE